MQKLNVLAFGTVSLGLTTLGLVWQNYYLDLLVSSGGGFLLIRVMAVAFMLAYVFRPQARNHLAQSAMRSLGITLLIFGLVTFFSPTFLGHFNSYIPFGDTLLFIEGGILATLLSLELPVHGPSLMDKNLKYLAVLLAAQPRKLLPTTRS
jgi:hypothetical protein